MFYANCNDETLNYLTYNIQKIFNKKSIFDKYMQVIFMIEK